MRKSMIQSLNFASDTYHNLAALPLSSASWAIRTVRIIEWSSLLVIAGRAIPIPEGLFPILKNSPTPKITKKDSEGEIAAKKLDILILKSTRFVASFAIEKTIDYCFSPQGAWEKVAQFALSKVLEQSGELLVSKCLGYSNMTFKNIVVIPCAQRFIVLGAALLAASYTNGSP